MKTTEEMIEIMNAYVDDKTIECRDRSGGYWLEIPDPIWDWLETDYRIKQEWYDNIPEGGIDCWVWDYDGQSKMIREIFSYKDNVAYPFRSEFNSVEIGYVYAEPIKKSDFKFLEDM